MRPRCLCSFSTLDSLGYTKTMIELIINIFLFGFIAPLILFVWVALMVKLANLVAWYFF